MPEDTNSSNTIKPLLTIKKIYPGWGVVGGAFCLLFCASGTQYYAFPVFFDAMIRDMTWSRAQTAAAMSIGTFVTGLAGMGIGVLLRRIRLRTITMFGCVVAAVAYVLLSRISEIWQFYILYGVILSGGIAFIDMVPDMTAVSSWFVKNRSIALGIATTGVGAGGAIIAPLAGWIISTYNWQTGFLALAAIIMFIGLPVSTFIMRSRGETKYSVNGPNMVGDLEDLSPPGITLRQATRRKSFWFISISVLLWALAFNAGLAHQVAFAVDIGIGQVAAAGAVGILTASSIIGRIGFGKLGDIIDKRYLFMCAALLEAAAFIVLLNTSNITELYFYSILLGFSAGGIMPILPGLVSDYFGTKHFSLVYSAASMVLSIGAAIGPLFAGLVFDTWESYYAAFLISILLSLVVIASIALAGKPEIRTIKN